jgi:tetratricopeptide (TPR) repeat protein
MLNKVFMLVILTVCAVATLQAQTAPGPKPSPRPNTSAPSTQTTGFDLTEYGVRLEPDQRLIIVMAALDAAGFDSTPGKEPSAFRALLKKDLAALDPDLRRRLREFYERNKRPAPAGPADEAARYVSLAYALSPAPALDAPERSDDLPAGVLEVLDFAPLVREFYKKSGIDERLPAYIRAYYAEADRMRRPTADMVREILTYLHTRPVTTVTERVQVKSPDKKKNAKTAYTTVEHERRFFIVPDLLAAPGTINFRVIADDYFTIVPEGTNPASSELRRAYIQYVVDALVLRGNKEIAARREQIKQLIDVRTKEGATISPDAFVVVSRSLVAAADARLEESLRLAAVDALQRTRVAAAKDDATRSAIVREAQSARAAIGDEAIARLAEEYENGAALDFYFADQLRDISQSGFDVANFFGDMIAGIDPVRETKRLAEAKTARDRAIAARKAHPYYSTWLMDPSFKVNEGGSGDPRDAGLTKSLKEVETLLQTRNYPEAETKLKGLLQEHPGDARLMFALGQTASLWARDTTDDDLQEQRLNQALANYGLAVQAASPDSDRVLLSRAHEAMGRILAFLDRKDEAMKEFDAAIRVGEVAGGAYRDAIEGKRKLSQP